MIFPRCLDYLNEILARWEISEKEADVVADAVKLGLEDASVRARELGRSAYLALFQKYPKKTERIKQTLTSTLRTRMIKAETDLNSQLGLASSKDSAESGPAVRPAFRRAHSTPSSSSTKKAAKPSPSSKSDKSDPSDGSVNASADFLNKIGFQNLGEGEDDINFVDSDDQQLPTRTLTRRESFQDCMVTSIQAVVRGGLVRRNSSNSSSSSGVQNLGRADSAEIDGERGNDAPPRKLSSSTNTNSNNSSRCAQSTASLSPAKQAASQRNKALASSTSAAAAASSMKDKASRAGASASSSKKESSASNRNANATAASASGASSARSTKVSMHYCVYSRKYVWYSFIHPFIAHTQMHIYVIFL